MRSVFSPLYVPELLAMILDHIDIDDNVSTARVCRGWSEPSFYRIWHTIRSLVPLFKLIGPMSRGTQSNWQFTNDIQNADWSRYAIYAHRIRHFDLFNWMGMSDRVSSQAMQAVLDHTPSHLKLPRPSSILIASSTATFPEARLITNSLRKLTVNHGFVTIRDASLGPIGVLALNAASQLSDGCLEDLSLRLYGEDSAVLDAFCACLTKHSSCLIKLCAKFLFSDQTWQSIFNLQALRSLEIAPLQPSDPRPLDTILAHLNTLTKAHPLLENLKLDLPLPATGRLNPDISPALYYQVIHCLRELQCLKSLHLLITAPLSLSEDQVRKMAACWPKLHDLQLKTISDWYPKAQANQRSNSQINITTIPHFLRYFTRLEELHIGVMCDSPLVPRPDPITASAFRLLNVAKSLTPSASPTEVAAYLLAFLPKGSSVRHELVYGPRGGFWETVSQTVNAPDPDSGDSESDGSESYSETDTVESLGVEANSNEE